MTNYFPLSLQTLGFIFTQQARSSQHQYNTDISICNILLSSCPAFTTDDEGGDGVPEPRLSHHTRHWTRLWCSLAVACCLGLSDWNTPNTGPRCAGHYQPDVRISCLIYDNNTEKDRREILRGESLLRTNIKVSIIKALREQGWWRPPNSHLPPGCGNTLELNRREKVPNWVCLIFMCGSSC